MGYKAAVQVLKEAEDLKSKVLKKTDLLQDQQAWTDQQKLQAVYHQVLVLDLEYALDKKVEQDLWNVGFKNHITLLQEQTRDKRNLRRSDCQALLTWCLEAASGFYITLLHELCNLFDIDLPFRRRGNVYGQANSPSELNLPQSSSCLYICQYCLVHLGDIARYRNQRKQAENFYKEAIQVSPTSGHPYNQLALLEASQGDKLSTVFYYIRGIALKNPFPAATTNLCSTLNSTIDKESPLEKVHMKITVNEFIQIFLSTHALLQSSSELKQAELGVKSLNSTMTALVATQSFTFDKLIKITAINLYSFRQFAAVEELTKDEKLARIFILDLIAGSLSAFLVPIHTLKSDESILEYYALPAVKLLMYWIRQHPDILKEEVFKNRLQIWPSLCKLLNTVQKYIKDFNSAKYEKTPLYEDKMLDGFKPLLKSFKDLNFKGDGEDVDDIKIENLIRARRIVDFGLYMTEVEINEFKFVTKEKDEEGNINFKPGCVQPDPTNDLLEEMKSFNISEVQGRKSGERKGGILKPQGSLEKAREERELQDSEVASQASAAKKDSVKAKRTKQNVALQSIFKKIEESKQVKFSVDDSEAKEKEKVNFEVKKSPPSSFVPLRPPQPYKMGFPVVQPVPPPDYLSTLRNVSNLQPPAPFPPNTEVPPPGMSLHQSQMANSYNHPPHPNAQFLTHHEQTFNHPPPAMVRSIPPPPNYQNVHPFSGGGFAPPSAAVPPHQGKKDTWWPQTTPGPPAQRHEGYFNTMGYSNPMRLNYNKQQGNQAGGDMFNSVWSNLGGGGISPLGYEAGPQTGVSMRQAMLKEANNAAGASSRSVQSHDNFGQNPPPTTPGYSLFNANSWTPNLVGQLRMSNKPQEGQPMNHLPQHSLFTGLAPQSLSQLLEQQKSQKNDQ